MLLSKSRYLTGLQIRIKKINDFMSHEGITKCVVCSKYLPNDY